MRDEMTALRDAIGAMRYEFQTTTKQASEAVTLAARVSVVEARLGEVVNNVQTMQSFISLAKNYSVKAAFAVLISIIIGVSATTKVIEWFVSIFK